MPRKSRGNVTPEVKKSIISTLTAGRADKLGMSYGNWLASMEAFHAHRLEDKDRDLDKARSRAQGPAFKLVPAKRVFASCKPGHKYANDLAEKFWLTALEGLTL